MQRAQRSPAWTARLVSGLCCLCLLSQSSCWIGQLPLHRALTVARRAAPAEPRSGIDWDNLGFGLTTKDTKVAIATCEKGSAWKGFRTQPYGPLPLEPAATILNYGQGIFEGMKAYRTTKGRIVLFRPEMNAQRIAAGAERFLMPPVPGELFLEMCGAVVRENADWVPPAGKGELYLRPLLFGSGGALGVGASPEYTCVIFAAPVGKYFSGAGARLKLESEHQRAAPLGVGDVKAAGNYAPCFAAQKAAKEAGYSDVLYLDVSGQKIEEAAASNFFCLGKDKVLRTPSLGTILPGVTRDTVIKLAESVAAKGHPELAGVQVGDVSPSVIFEAKEAFVCGTGAGISPVAHVGGSQGSVDLDSPGPVTRQLKDSLKALQQETAPDEWGWLWDPLSGQEAPSSRVAKLK